MKLIHLNEQPPKRRNVFLPGSQALMGAGLPFAACRVTRSGTASRGRPCRWCNSCCVHSAAISSGTVRRRDSSAAGWISRQPRGRRRGTQRSPRGGPSERCTGPTSGAIRRRCGIARHVRGEQRCCRRRACALSRCSNARNRIAESALSLRTTLLFHLGSGSAVPLWPRLFAGEKRELLGNSRCHSAPPLVPPSLPAPVLGGLASDISQLSPEPAGHNVFLYAYQLTPAGRLLWTPVINPVAQPQKM